MQIEFPNFGKAHESQRGFFAASLYEQMVVNKDVWLLMGDLGYAVFDKHRRDFPDRVVNVGAAEQSMMGIANGLSLEGKRVFTYTITSFYLRAAETISLYQAGEGIPVQMIGSGFNDDYKHDGPSHDGRQAQWLLDAMGVNGLYPQTKEQIPDIVKYLSESQNPNLLVLRR